MYIKQFLFLVVLFCISIQFVACVLRINPRPSATRLRRLLRCSRIPSTPKSCDLGFKV